MACQTARNSFWVRFTASDNGAKKCVMGEQGDSFWSPAHANSSLKLLGASHSGNFPQARLGTRSIETRKTEQWLNQKQKGP